MGFLFIRFGMNHDILWSWLGEYVLDDEEFKPSPDSEWRTTVGEYVEGLLSQDKYYSTVVPRLPMSTKRNLEAKLAPVAQCRKRTRANKGILDIYAEEGTKVEAIRANSNGEWDRATVVELVHDNPSRLKVMLRFEDNTEEMVHLGKVILKDSRVPPGRTMHRRSRSRGRGRSRSRSPNVDWTRHKGRTDAELIDELRSKDREKAVCSSGKDYARKPLGYKAACALPREQGAASYRLMEEETFVPMSRQKRARSPSPESQVSRKAPSAEHQANMQRLFEKYGNTRGPEATARSDDGIDRPDVMRLG
jgi:pre-mRNA-splicing factor 38B